MTLRRLSLVTKHSAKNRMWSWISRVAPGQTVCFGDRADRKFPCCRVNVRMRRSVRVGLIHLPFLTNPLLAPGSLTWIDQKCTHGRYPLEYPLVHVISLDQSPSWIELVKHGAPPCFPHTSPTSQADQYGSNVGESCAFDCSFPCPIGPIEECVAFAVEETLPADPV